MKNLFLALYSNDISMGDAVLIAVLSMLIVFAVLFLIILIIQIIQKTMFSNKKVDYKDANNEMKNVSSKVNSKSVSQNNVNKKNTDIKDEDMMVAALIATIDYTNETKKDVRLVSIKEIK